MQPGVYMGLAFVLGMLARGPRFVCVELKVSDSNAIAADRQYLFSNPDKKMSTALNVQADAASSKIGWLLEASSVEADVLLQSDREYTLVHTGKDSSGVGATGMVAFQTAATVAADYSASADENADKIVLESGAFRMIGPGVSKLFFKAAAGSPMIQIIPGRKLGGAW